MDQGGPTDTREAYFKEASEEMIRARTLCAKANAVLPDDPSYMTYLEELFGQDLSDVRILTPIPVRFWQSDQVRKRGISQPLGHPLRFRRHRI